jgi:hypothetical protein
MNTSELQSNTDPILFHTNPIKAIEEVWDIRDEGQILLGYIALYDLDLKKVTRLILQRCEDIDLIHRVMLRRIDDRDVRYNLYSGRISYEVDDNLNHDHRLITLAREAGAEFGVDSDAADGKYLCMALTNDANIEVLI